MAKSSLQVYSFPGPELPYSFTREGANASLNSWDSLDQPTLTTIASPAVQELTWTAGAYRALILGIDGALYSPPFLANANVLVVDPTTDTAQIESFGLNSLTTGQGNYMCGALAPNGKIYCPPYNNSNILIINTVDRSTVKTNMGIDFSADRKYPVSVAASDGKIYCPGRQNCLIIDTATDTATTTKFAGNIVGNAPLNILPEWGSGVRSLVDDKLYFAPKYLRTITVDGNLVTVPGNVLIIDPVTQTAEVSKFSSAAMANGATYGGIANGPDGKLYLSPYGPTINDTNNSAAQYWTVIDPIAGTSVDYSVGSSVTHASSGCVAGDDKVVYGAPSVYGDIAPSDPASNAYVYFRDGTPGNSSFNINLSAGTEPDNVNARQVRWWGGCLAPNGKIYSLPDMKLFGDDNYLRSSILVLNVNGTGHTSTQGFRDLISTSYFNKGGT